MHLSPIGAAALIAREGRRLKAYRDSVGVWTIGVGHTSAAGPPAVRGGLAITSAECDAIFARDVEKFAGPVWEAVKDIPGQPQLVPQHAFDALVSLAFNIGVPAFLRSSVLRRLRAGDRDGAAEAMLMWDRPAQIVPRRQAEYDQFRAAYETALPKARRSNAERVVVAVATAPGVTVPAPIAPAPVTAGLDRPVAAVEAAVPIAPIAPAAPAMSRWQRFLAAIFRRPEGAYGESPAAGA